MLILEELKNLAEEDYKAFNNKIIPTKQTTLGVRLPILRKIAKRIAKEKAIEFVQLDKQNIYEMIMLEGFVLSHMEKSFKELLPFTETFLLKVDNWAQVDSTICDFKKITKEKEDVLVIVKKWLKSDKEFFVRAGLVILLAHFVEKENVQMIFEMSQSVVHTGYYVHMGNAWLISCCMAKFPEETLVFFRNNTLDNKTHNKAIQKSRESYRVLNEHKVMINELKRKSSG
ncbi:MAG: DNA alkylation repair protein [Deltaproteobacteria bacterium]|jgi:3-methyladenine DNA glycosylase AlkD|nr:DNA alkylation repair protein [Deltaproteobacteria bacterium]